MPKFSCILNSRARPFLLNCCINSILETAANPDEIEILVRYDHDDEKTQRVVNSNKHKNIVFLGGPRPSNLHTELNKLAKIAHSPNVFILNDDAHLETAGWDQIVLSQIERSGVADGIYLCNTDDNSLDRDRTKGYCAFPIISKEAVSVLGFAMMEKFVGLGGDSSIFRIFNSVGRIIDCKDVKISHVLHLTLHDINNPDETAARMRANTAANFVDPYTCDLNEEIQKLRDYITDTSYFRYEER